MVSRVIVRRFIVEFIIKEYSCELFQLSAYSKKKQQQNYKRSKLTNEKKNWDSIAFKNGRVRIIIALQYEKQIPCEPKLTF
jgi:hypothetical protein